MLVLITRFKEFTSIAIRDGAHCGKVYLPLKSLVPGFKIKTEATITEIRILMGSWLILNYLIFIAGMIFAKKLNSFNFANGMLLFITLDYAIMFLGIKFVTRGLERTEENLSIKFTALQNRARNVVIGYFLLSIGTLLIAILGDPSLQVIFRNYFANESQFSFFLNFSVIAQSFLCVLGMALLI